jgi:hypothetical protein
MLFCLEVFGVLDLPVLAADVGRRLHHGKQQTNHHENCQSRCDDHIDSQYLLIAEQLRGHYNPFEFS